MATHGRTSFAIFMVEPAGNMAEIGVIAPAVGFKDCFRLCGVFRGNGPAAYRAIAAWLVLFSTGLAFKDVVAPLIKALVFHVFILSGE